MFKRIPREEPTYKINLMKPVTQTAKDKMIAKESDTCFGKHWDAAENECSMCADTELCCLLMRDKNAVRARALEEKNGVKWLDKSDFSRVDKKKIIFQCDLKSGDLKTDDLITEVLNQANSSDKEAAVEWIKRLKAEDTRLTMKKGYVYYARD